MRMAEISGNHRKEATSRTVGTNECALAVVDATSGEWLTLRFCLWSWDSRRFVHELRRLPIALLLEELPETSDQSADELSSSCIVDCERYGGGAAEKDE